MLEGRDRHRALDLVAARVVCTCTQAEHTLLDAGKCRSRCVHRPSWPSTTVSSTSALSFYEQGTFCYVYSPVIELI